MFTMLKIGGPIVTLRPVAYAPLEGRLWLLRSGTIRIDFAHAPSAEKSIEESAPVNTEKYWRRLESRIVQPPVRILWGEDDVALCPALAELSAGSCMRAELVRIPGAGHWVQHEAAGRIDDLLLDFLA